MNLAEAVRAAERLREAHPWTRDVRPVPFWGGTRVEAVWDSGGGITGTEAEVAAALDELDGPCL